MSEHNNIASGENPLRANWGVGNIFGFGLVKKIFLSYLHMNKTDDSRVEREIDYMIGDDMT